MYTSDLSVFRYESGQNREFSTVELEVAVAFLLKSTRTDYRLLFKLSDPFLTNSKMTIEPSDLTPLGEVKSTYNETKTVILLNNDIVHCEYLIMVSADLTGLSDPREECQHEFAAGLHALDEYLSYRGKSLLRDLYKGIDSKISVSCKHKKYSSNIPSHQSNDQKIHCHNIHTIMKNSMSKKNTAKAESTLEKGAVVFS